MCFLTLKLLAIIILSNQKNFFFNYFMLNKFKKHKLTLNGFILLDNKLFLLIDIELIKQ